MLHTAKLETGPENHCVSSKNTFWKTSFLVKRSFNRNHCRYIITCGRWCWSQCGSDNQFRNFRSVRSDRKLTCYLHPKNCSRKREMLVAAPSSFSRSLNWCQLQMITILRCSQLRLVAFCILLLRVAFLTQSSATFQNCCQFAGKYLSSISQCLLVVLFCSVHYIGRTWHCSSKK